jgi:hypothetical protein
MRADSGGQSEWVGNPIGSGRETLKNAFVSERKRPFQGDQRRSIHGVTPLDAMIYAHEGTKARDSFAVNIPAIAKYLDRDSMKPAEKATPSPSSPLRAFPPSMTKCFVPVIAFSGRQSNLIGYGVGVKTPSACAKSRQATDGRDLLSAP